MPGIDISVLLTSIFLYPGVSAANQGRGGGGCGVLVGVPAENWPNAVHLYGVTNAHVVHQGGVVARATRMSGQTWVFDQSPTDWTVHRDGDDLAACLLHTVPSKAGEAGLSMAQTFYWIAVDSLVKSDDLGWFMSTGRPYPWSLGPIRAGEEVFSISRFIGFDGVERNEPTVRFGNLAAQHTVSIPQPETAYNQESLLIEARSLNGSSGAPVFLHRTMIAPPGTKLQFTELPAFDPLLLGLGWGHIKHPEDEASEFEVEREKPGRPTPGRYNSGMMAVVPSWKLTELLMDEDVVAVRRAAEVKGKRTGFTVLESGGN